MAAENAEVGSGGFRGSILGVPIMRIIVFGSLFFILPVYGNYRC